MAEEMAGKNVYLGQVHIQQIGRQRAYPVGEPAYSPQAAPCIPHPSARHCVKKGTQLCKTMPPAEYCM